MAGFCAAQTGLGLVENLLTGADCNMRVVSELGYRLVSAPDSEIALALTAALTIYVAIFGLRLLLGMTPLKVSGITVAALKIGLVLAMATNWPAYQQVVFDTLFRGPEQLAASMLAAVQAPGSLLHGNPFDGLQLCYDQLQAAAVFFLRISPPGASPLSAGVPFTALGLNLSSFALLFAFLGTILAAKVVLGLLLALGPLFVAFLLFDATRGVFEGWLRAILAFALVPLFATLALSVQLILIEPYLTALSQMRDSGQPNLAAATSAFILAFIASGVSLASMIGIFVVALGFKLPARAGRARGGDEARIPVAALQPATVSSPPPPAAAALQPRVAATRAAAASLDRRDARLLDGGEAIRRPNQTTSDGGDSAKDRRAATNANYRRSARPRRAASSARRDR